MCDVFNGIKNSVIVNKSTVNTNVCSNFRCLEDAVARLSYLLKGGQSDYLVKDLSQMQRLASDHGNQKDVSQLWDKIRKQLPNAANIATCANAITQIVSSFSV